MPQPADVTTTDPSRDSSLHTSLGVRRSFMRLLNAAEKRDEERANALEIKNVHFVLTSTNAGHDDRTPLLHKCESAIVNKTEREEPEIVFIKGQYQWSGHGGTDAHSRGRRRRYVEEGTEQRR